MSTYALTFATRADFDTDLASGNIYSLMQGVTSSAPSVAIAAHITESGETFSCGTNVMIDIKSVGPGDVVLYDTTNKKFFGIASKWIDNNYPDQPTQHIMIFKTGVLPARFVTCGSVIRRHGNRIRLAATVNDNLPWTTTASSGYGWDVPALTDRNAVIKMSGTSTTSINTGARVAFGSVRYQENAYPSGNADYLPIRRETWEAAIAAGNTTVTENGKTVTMADYGNDFDRFLRYHYAPKYPVSSGAMAEDDGMANTKKIVDEFVANHDKSYTSVDYAAGYCYNHTPGDSIPGLEKHKWFLATLKDAFEVRTLSYTLISPYSWINQNICTCVQSGANYFIGVLIRGYPSIVNKNSTYRTVPLADLIIST